MEALVWLVVGGVAVAVINTLTRLSKREPDQVSARWLKERWFEESIRERRM